MSAKYTSDDKFTKNNTISAMGIVFMLIFITISSTPIFAQTTPTQLSVTIDKNSYLPGDSIVVTGKAYPVAGLPLGIQVLDPSNNPVGVYQTNVNSDGTYSVTITAGGPMWNTSGTYTIQVQREQGNTAQTSFAFSVQIATTTGVSHVLVSNSQQTFDVSYSISGGTVNDISADLKGLSLDVSINSNTDGSITLQIPRQLLDAKTNSGQDDVFIILVDGAEVKPQNEQKDDTSRTMTIYFFKGNTNIQITGTEFPFQTGHTITTPTLQQNPSQSNGIQKVPAWVKNVFIWYGQGKISEDDLLGAIKFLVDEGIIQLRSN
ncbi:MAG: PEFG-CTERM sorting domain-containing protein [Nitrosotalea sp.]